MSIEWIGYPIEKLEQAEKWAAANGLQDIQAPSWVFSGLDDREVLKVYVTTRSCAWLGEDFLAEDHIGRWWDGKQCATVYQKLDGGLILSHWRWIRSFEDRWSQLIAEMKSREGPDNADE